MLELFLRSNDSFFDLAEEECVKHDTEGCKGRIDDTVGLKIIQTAGECRKYGNEKIGEGGSQRVYDLYDAHYRGSFVGVRAYYIIYGLIGLVKEAQENLYEQIEEPYYYDFRFIGPQLIGQPYHNRGKKNNRKGGPYEEGKKLSALHIVVVYVPCTPYAYGHTDDIGDNKHILQVKGLYSQGSARQKITCVERYGAGQ